MIEATNAISSTSLMDTVRQITQTSQAMTSGGVNKTDASSKAPSFGDMLTNLVQSVNQKGIEADVSAREVMTGKSNNIHQAMLSMQEAGVAFTMMSEVRTKLVSAYNELMRMQV